MNFTRASLIADALSLGPHWVYSQGKLDTLYPEGINTYTDPASDFHPNRKAGQFTHYGDQTRMLEASIKALGIFTTGVWREKWMASMQQYDGYIDGASKQTLENKGEAPSESDDLAGAARIGPILDLSLPLGPAIQAARQQTTLTHGALGVADAAEYFVRAVYALKEGESMESAFAKAASEGTYSELKPAECVEKAKAADPVDFRKVGKEFGLTCHLPEAFPLTLYFALRPGANFAHAISDNGVTGGDTSARAMLMAILFAAQGDSSIDQFELPPALL